MISLVRPREIEYSMEKMVDWASETYGEVTLDPVGLSYDFGNLMRRLDPERLKEMANNCLPHWQCVSCGKVYHDYAEAADCCIDQEYELPHGTSISIMVDEVIFCEPDPGGDSVEIPMCDIPDLIEFLKELVEDDED